MPLTVLINCSPPEPFEVPGSFVVADNLIAASLRAFAFSQAALRGTGQFQHMYPCLPERHRVGAALVHNCSRR